MGREETAPLGKGSGSVPLEDVTAGGAAILVEVVGSEGTGGGEFLKTSHAPETEPSPLSAAKHRCAFFRPLLTEVKKLHLKMENAFQGAARGNNPVPGR